jgi:hypothetical protein
VSDDVKEERNDVISLYTTYLKTLSVAQTTIKIYRCIIFIVLYGNETWSVTLRE